MDRSRGSWWGALSLMPAHRRSCAALALAASSAGCSGAPEGLYPPPSGTATLQFADGTSATGMADATRLEDVPASASRDGCPPSKVLVPGRDTGIQWAVVLASTAPGEQSSMGEAAFHFSQVDPQAQAGSRPDSWSGVVTVGSWESSRVVFDLTGGELCIAASCGEVDGQLVFEGEITMDDPANAGVSSGWIDTSSGEELCAPADAEL